MLRTLTIIFVLALLAIPALAQTDDNTRLILDTESPSPSSIMLEIERMGLFPAGGTPAPVDNTYRTLLGNQFISLSDAESEPNFVFGGSILFESWDSPGDVQACALVARATTQRDITETDTERIEVAQINTFVDIGVTNMDEVYIADRFGPEDDEVVIERIETDIAYKAPIEMVSVMLDNRLTVYVNAERVVYDMEIQAEGGGFAFALNGTDSRTNCTVDGAWAYALEADYVGEGCEITTAATINQRGGPGTEFDVLSQLSAGDIAMATGQTVDAEGFTWWQLENQLWMREDVVTARGYCRTLPQIPA